MAGRCDGDRQPAATTDLNWKRRVAEERAARLERGRAARGGCLDDVDSGHLQQNIARLHAQPLAAAGRSMLDAALRSPLYKAVMVPMAKSYPGGRGWWCRWWWWSWWWSWSTWVVVGGGGGRGWSWVVVVVVE